MSKRNNTILLTAEERKELKRIVSKGTCAARTIKRANVLLNLNQRSGTNFNLTDLSHLLQVSLPTAGVLKTIGTYGLTPNGELLVKNADSEIRSFVESFIRKNTLQLPLNSYLCSTHKTRHNMNNTFTSTQMDLAPKTIPGSWHHCFNERCPLKDECLRFFSGQNLTPSTQIGLAIYPNALVNNACAHFVEKRIENLAWGFSRLFSQVKKVDDTPLREQIKHYLGGHGTFYRYKNGERKLTSEQQEWILQAFQERGYTLQHPIFDHYIQQYVFAG